MVATYAHTNALFLLTRVPQSKEILLRRGALTVTSLHIYIDTLEFTRLFVRLSLWQMNIKLGTRLFNKEIRCTQRPVSE